MIVNEKNIKSSYLIAHQYIDCWNIEAFVSAYLKDLSSEDSVRFRKIIRDIKNGKIDLEFSNASVREKCLENLTKAVETFEDVYWDYCCEDNVIDSIKNLLAKISKIVKEGKVLN